MKPLEFRWSAKTAAAGRSEKADRWCLLWDAAKARPGLEREGSRRRRGVVASRRNRGSDHAHPAGPKRRAWLRRHARQGHGKDPTQRVGTPRPCPSLRTFTTGMLVVCG